MKEKEQVKALNEASTSVLRIGLLSQLAFVHH